MANVNKKNKRMISDIISAFENNFRDKCCEVCANHTEFIKDEDSAIATLYFNNFDMELEYILESEERSEISWITPVLDFSKKAGKELRCSVYDIIHLVDEENFDCFFFCNIENPERMNKCFACLWKSLEKIIPLIDEFASVDENIKVIDEEFYNNTRLAIGTGIVYAYCLQLKEESVLDQYNTEDIIKDVYSAYMQSTLATERYNDFINGNWEKAYEGYNGLPSLRHESRICKYLETHRDNPRKLIDDGCESLNDGMKEQKTAKGFVAFIFSWAVLFVPFVLLCLSIYYGITTLIFGNMLYSTSLEWYNSIYSMIPATILSLVTAIVARENIFRKLFRGKKDKNHDYNYIFMTERKTFKQAVTVFLVYIITILFVFLSANTGVSFGKNTIADHTDYLSTSGTTYSYSDIEGLYVFTDRDDSKCYGIVMNDKECIVLTKFASISDVEENILPIIYSHGFELRQGEPSYTMVGDFIGIYEDI